MIATRSAAVPGLPLRLVCGCGAAVWFSEAGLAKATAYMEEHREACMLGRRS